MRTGKKIEVMVCSKFRENNNIKMSDDTVKHVPKVQYLGIIQGYS